MTWHVPVLMESVLDVLAVREGGVYVDGTVGGGGHSAAIASRLGASGRLLALDRDEEALTQAGKALAGFGSRVTLRKTPFSRMEEVAAEAGFAPGTVDGVLLDLGVSSHQLDEAERGFSFRNNGPLDMRMDREQGETAAEVVQNASAEDLAAMFRELGDEPHAGRIARQLVKRRQEAPILTTLQLADAVERAVPNPRSRHHHPATQVFQALRMRVNREVEELEQGLEGAFSLLAPQGRMAVITFHSGEDRRVKRFIRERTHPCVCPPDLPVCGCGRKPSLQEIHRGGVVASPEEMKANPRARSARLRAARRIVTE